MKEQITNSLGLPKDIMLHSSILTITGRNEAFVENYRGIIEYTDTVLKLQTKTCKIRITGKNIVIDYFTNDDMKIKGVFDEIKYYQ